MRIITRLGCSSEVEKLDDPTVSKIPRAIAKLSNVGQLLEG
jgi:hypothetical protein